MLNRNPQTDADPKFKDSHISDIYLVCVYFSTAYHGMLLVEINTRNCSYNECNHMWSHTNLMVTF